MQYSPNKSIDLRPQLEQIYYARAIQAVADARKQSAASAAWDNELSWWVMIEAMHDLGDEVDPDEDPTVAAKRLARGLGHEFGLFLQSLILTHVLCTMTLEAHVNNTANVHLEPPIRKTFEHLSLKGKWLLLPRLLSSSGFDPGSEPFQEFAWLVALRNRLVHAKGEDLVFILRRDSSPHELLQEGLADAERSLRIVDQMVRFLAQILDTSPPSWLDEAESTPYRLEYDA